MNAWLFLGNPKLYYRIRQGLRHFRANGRPTTWLVRQHKDVIKVGDQVFFWQTGPEAAIVGWGTILHDPQDLPHNPEEDPFIVNQAKFAGIQPRVRIKVDGECVLARRELLQDERLRDWGALRHGQGTNLLIAPQRASELLRIVRAAHAQISAN